MTAADGMPCPICRVSLMMSERQGVEIDYCPQCRGVWLDRGELDKIIARSAADFGGPAMPPSRPEPAASPQAPAASPQAPAASPWSAPSPDPYRHGADPHAHQYGHHYGRGKPPKRRKSFLEELFD